MNTTSPSEQYLKVLVALMLAVVIILGLGMLLGRTILPNVFPNLFPNEIILTPAETQQVLLRRAKNELVKITYHPDRTLVVATSMSDKASICTDNSSCYIDLDHLMIEGPSKEGVVVIRYSSPWYTSQGRADDPPLER